MVAWPLLHASTLHLVAYLVASTNVAAAAIVASTGADEGRSSLSPASVGVGHRSLVRRELDFGGASGQLEHRGGSGVGADEDVEAVSLLDEDPDEATGDASSAETSATSKASANGNASTNKSVDCYNITRQDSPYGRFIYKMPSTAQCSEGMEGWHNIAEDCDKYDEPINCKDMCQVAACWLKHTSCGDPENPVPCADDVANDIQGSSYDDDNVPSGCIVNLETKQVRYNSNKDGANSDKVRPLCYFERPHVPQAAAPFVNSTPTSPGGNVTSWDLSTCGVTGRMGPTQRDCDMKYPMIGMVHVVGGMQIITIPQRGMYKVSAFGAQGGRHGHANGGYGALVEAEMALYEFDMIGVIVGQKGSGAAEDRATWGGGGGGASIVVKIVKRGGKPMRTLGHIEVRPLVIAAGGAGSTGRRTQGLSLGGRDFVDMIPEMGAMGGASGGGGGYLFNGIGGNITGTGKVADAFLHGAFGGGTEEHFGGFGGGGGPNKGGGGGGGFIGGACLIDGTNNDCEGGTSFGGANVTFYVTPANNTGDGAVLLRRVGDIEATMAVFVLEQNNKLFKGIKHLDFDFGCGAVTKMCKNFVEVGSKYQSFAVDFEGAHNLFNLNSYSRGFCAAGGAEKGDRYGKGKMKLQFTNTVSRFGFYYLGEDPTIIVDVFDTAGNTKQFVIENNADARPTASSFFGAEGKNIKRIEIMGVSYCIDDFRWLDDPSDLQAYGTVDFAFYAKKYKRLDMRELEFQAASGAYFFVQGWGRADPEANGFVCNGANGCDLTMSLRVEKLAPMGSYHFKYWGFQDRGTVQVEPKWKLFAGDALVGESDEETELECEYPEGETRPTPHMAGWWFTFCQPVAEGTVEADKDGKLLFTWQRKDEGPKEGMLLPGNIVLSAFAVYRNLLIPTTTTTTLGARYLVDEQRCDNFQFHGWTDEKHVVSSDGKLHGPYSFSQNEKRYMRMPPHNAIVWSIRYWALGEWSKNEATIYQDDVEKWREQVTMDCQKDSCQPGWTAYEDYVPLAASSAQILKSSMWNVFDGDVKSGVIEFLTNGMVKYNNGAAQGRWSKVAKHLAVEINKELWKFVFNDGDEKEATQIVEQDANEPAKVLKTRTNAQVQKLANTEWFQGKVILKFLPDGTVHKNGVKNGRWSTTGQMLQFNGKSYALDPAGTQAGSPGAETLLLRNPADACKKCYKDIATGVQHVETSSVVGVAGQEKAGVVSTGISSQSWALGRLRLIVGQTSTNGTIYNESEEALGGWSDEKTLDFLNNSHGPFSLGSKVSQTFDDIGHHDFLLLRLRYYTIGKWEPSDAIVTVDGIEVFRKRRSAAGACPDANFPWHQGMVSTMGQVCFFDVSTGIPHNGSTAVIEVSSTPTGGSRGFFSFASTVLEMGREKRRCQAKHCDAKQHYALIEQEDGSLWCGEMCDHASCCEKRGVCNKFCNYEDGYIIIPHPPKMCRGAVCTREECCMKREQCDVGMCGAGSKLKLERPSYCFLRECVESECCEKRGVCKRHRCPVAHKPNPFTVSRICKEKRCTDKECCDRLGECDKYECEIGWAKLQTDGVVCEGRICRLEECCFKLATCSLDVCPRHGELKTVLPRFCEDSKCSPAECCDMLASCGQDENICKAEGWLPKRYVVEVCAGRKCEPEECCEPRGLCGEVVCPAGFLPRFTPPIKKWCDHTVCELLECCESEDSLSDLSAASGDVLPDSSQSDLPAVNAESLLSAQGVDASLIDHSMREPTSSVTVSEVATVIIVVACCCLAYFVWTRMSAPALKTPVDNDSFVSGVRGTASQ
eukprot:TRINITY_DN8549_c0_g4_i1.p1 TRINITY_DN8549_c0_g4~~TRINITY_DN8549_c0_g4_i1.p1  ORF type:complete len:1784 (+),score=197.57 TRINITY_DN8549_c0_g4_i1:169-5520(+)